MSNFERIDNCLFIIFLVKFVKVFEYKFIMFILIILCWVYLFIKVFFNGRISIFDIREYQREEDNNIFLNHLIYTQFII